MSESERLSTEIMMMMIMISLKGTEMCNTMLCNASTRQSKIVVEQGNIGLFSA